MSSLCAFLKDVVEPDHGGHQNMVVPGTGTPQTGVVALSAPKTLLQPKQPDLPLQHHLPEDTSGLTATHRAPLALDPYNLNMASTRVSSSSASFTLQPSTSSTMIPSASANTSSSSPSTDSAAPVTNTFTPAGTVPGSTTWRWRVQEENKRRAREQGKPFKKHKRASYYNCRRLPKTREYGHSRYKGESFCSQADGRSVEQWLAEKKQLPPLP